MINNFKPDDSKSDWFTRLESAFPSPVSVRQVRNDVPIQEISNDVPDREISNDVPVPAVRNDVPVQAVRNDVSVISLRACYRVPLKQYTPKQWFFGLHNRDVLHASESQDLKIALAAACELGPWAEFCASVVDDPVCFLRAYGLDHGDPMFTKKEVQYLLTLDALTIFFVFAESVPATGVQQITNVVDLIRKRMPWGYAQVPIDLFLFENQIPIFLLENVISQCYGKWGVQDSQGVFKPMVRANVLKMCGFIFDVTRYPLDKFDEAYPDDQALGQCAHIVACVHRILCGANFGRTSQDQTIIIQSATSLKKAGIRIEGFKGLLDEVHFDKRCLCRPILFLPIVKLYDQTESYFRNLAMYEYYTTLECPFGEYLQLMTNLIREEGDVKHLIDCGVIQNRLATDKNAFHMWSNLQSELFLPNYSQVYRTMVSEINNQCKSSLNVMRTEFIHLFCSRPWYVFGVFSATIVTVGTFLVAYTSVIGSHQMKPHYPQHYPPS